MADGVVTSEEYQTAFRAYSACLTAAGYDLRVEDSNGYLVDYGIPDAAVQSGVNDECYGSEFQQVDVTWQLANEDRSATSELLRTCLTERGITPGETAEELYTQLQEAGLAVEECY